MTWRSTASDAPRIELLIDPPWLLAPLFVRDQLPAELAADWSRWWASAVAFRPGGPAPRQEDLVAFSPALTERWRASGAAFETWLAWEVPADPTPPVEQERLISFEARSGHPPAPRTLTVLIAPFGGAFSDGELFLRPEPDRLVVDAALRLSGDRYRLLLDPVLADFF